MAEFLSIFRWAVLSLKAQMDVGLVLRTGFPGCEYLRLKIGVDMRVKPVHMFEKTVKR